MALQCGIIGLPNAGKSTIFNALTAAQVPAESYPFCTIDPNTGVVAVPDSRLDQVAAIFKSPKITPTVVEFVDIAGLVRGASKGEGLGNKFLGRIREVEALVHVVRCFEDPDVTHVEGSLDPLRDAELVTTELLLKDLETAGRRHQRVQKGARTGDKEAAKEALIWDRVLEGLDQGRTVRSLDLDENQLEPVKRLDLLTEKPVLYVANVDEEEIQRSDRADDIKALFALAESEGNLCIRLCGRLEHELSLLDQAEQLEFIEGYGLPEPGLDKLVHAAYRLLGYQTFFTGGPTEARAWTVPVGATAQEAAGQVHTDMARGFIKAEVYPLEVLTRLGSEQAVRDAGLARQEGKGYLVQDGDVIFFKFNV